MRNEHMVFSISNRKDEAYRYYIEQDIETYRKSAQ